MISPILAVVSLTKVTFYLVLILIFGSWFIYKFMSLTAETMYELRLSWHWARLAGRAFLFAATIGYLFGSVAFVVMMLVATVIARMAAHRGRRWEREETDKGGDAAKRAASMIDPGFVWRGLRNLFDLLPEESGGQPGTSSGTSRLKALSRVAATVRVSTVLGGAPNLKEQMLFVGYDEHNNGVFIPMKHLLLMGGTEFGKTTTINRILKEISKVQSAVQEGVGAVVLDGKGDDGLREVLRMFAQVMGVPFRCWSPTGNMHYDPLAHGSDTELVDRLLAVEEFEYSYFLRIAQRTLGLAARAFRLAGLRPTLKRFKDHVDPGTLSDLAAKIEVRGGRGSWGRFKRDLPKLSLREVDAVQGMQHRLAALTDSDFGHLLEPAPDGGFTLNLLEAVRNGEIVYFDLASDADPEVGQILGATVILDLTAVFATFQRTKEWHRTVVILDDVQSFASKAAVKGIRRIIARCRSVGGLIIYSSQSFADLIFDRDESLMNAIMDNVRTRIFHRLASPSSQKLASEALRDSEQMRLNARVDDRGRADGGTMRAERVAHFSGAELGQLPIGVAVVDVPEDGPVKTNIAA